MRNILLVLKHEFLTTVLKPSFWVTTFLLPGIIILLNIGTQIVSENAFEDSASTLIPGTDMTQSQHTAVIGYVDEAGIINDLPPSVPRGLLQKFADEEIAKKAINSGAIEQYYVIPADFAETGNLSLVSAEFTPFNVGTEDMFDYVLAYALTGDETEAAVYIDPTFSVYPQDLAPQQPNEDSQSPLTFFVPFAVMFIFFFLITMSSSFMLQSVTREKENRTAEVLLVSLRPRELMMGKVLGLSLVALLQLGFWLGGGLAALDRVRAMLEVAATYALPPGFIAWGIAFFILGFLVNASMMGAVGALAPNAREGGQFTFVILLPLLIPLWLNFAFLESPNGSLATGLSLFPLTAPVAMMTRMAATAVPVWQIAISLGGLALTTYGLVLLAARFFRADTLLSDASFDWRRLFTAFRGSD
ncbi:MAG: ABC transporter permease [Ardenticatenaceae bacterium]|nr:ABC transporter permease [Anaerolineales bacterium]MCB8923543.1 ABC transporter permease [Ardenticatenaceae bacterium]MCB8991886.1 ABC transporter permease [Ardenticatenaceae bacterium]MCB9003732.1 ABC transporter permease [Ardenticatenaceae bacterium]